MQLLRPGGAAILHHHDVEALVGEAADGRGDALVGEDAADDDVLDAEVAQEQAQVGAGERAVGGLEDGDLVGLRRQLGDELGFPGGVRQEQVVEAGLLLAQRAVAAVLGQAGDAGEQALDAGGAEAGEQVADVGDDGALHPGVERRPAGALVRVVRDAAGRCSGRR